LLCGLLSSTQNIDIELERFLTMARRLMLEAAIAAPGEEFMPGLGFASALARQCFINEYVFFQSEHEIRQGSELRDALVLALESGRPVPAAWVVAVSAYVPLFVLPSSARLLEMEWPAAVAAIITQQVSEPLEVSRLRDAMPRLTPVEDAVSQMVRGHYEENPYPRWVRTAPARNPVTMAEYLNRKFPLAPFQRVIGALRPEVLCAGCGTGIATIEFAMAIRDSHFLAVDLSLPSLGYAQRKTRELGLTSVDYAQADILQLGATAMRFDVIESSGVLHHMADAFAGWRVLLSLLKPGGFMLVGLYSQIARYGIVRARALIAERGYGVSADEIRRARQELLEVSASEDLGIATTNSDFFGISTCRDLLFHSQELRLTLDDIAVFLKDDGLTFLGFEIEEHVLALYRKRFADDPAAVNLDHWKAFERDNPGTFSAMYMIWVQKAG
jgi:2-polyprenyl-3-methyl-5-hydroxy-6-metoxy-1,4-benzoquinol methylase